MRKKTRTRGKPLSKAYKKLALERLRLIMHRSIYRTRHPKIISMKMTRRCKFTARRERVKSSTSKSCASYSMNPAS